MIHDYLALTLPGGYSVSTSTYPNELQQFFNPSNNTSIGYLVSQFLQIALYIGGAVMVFWLGWGVFQYIFSGGSKERLAFARKRMIFALVGFMILLIAFAIQQYVKQSIFAPQLPSGVQDITQPP